ncbi:MAG: hypothetical protein Q4A25_00380 [Candidatus Saccharibacteria bacterium]|nr:hypothetical protein [Candidatus Saccharibacteria bacterium]
MKKTSRMMVKRIVSLVSFASLMLVLSAMLFPVARSNAQTEALAGSEVGVNVKEFVKLAVDKSALQLEDNEGHTTISPSPSGTSISGTVNVVVTTNVLKGYTLSVLTQDTSTGMTHSLSSVTTEIDAITSGATVLTANTWGFQKPGDTTHWYPIGAAGGSGTEIYNKSSDDAAYCADLDYPIPVACASSTYDTYAIKFGAVLTSALPAGTYSNNVVFSAVANADGARYNLNFNGNGGSGSMAPRTIMAGSTITMPENGFVKEGQGIRGWALTAGASNPATVGGKTLNAGESGISVDSLIAAAEAAGQTPATSGVMLYAVWDNQYTFSYVANAPTEALPVSGSMSATQQLLSSNATIPENGFSSETYNLVGWAFASDAASVAQISGNDVVSGGSFSTSAIVSAAAAAGQSVSTTSGGTVKFYGVWEIGTQYMQDFDCSTLESQKITTLVDNRDNHEYKVKKLPDGKCWMINNLTLTATDLVTEGKALTNANTNIPSSDSKSYYITPKNARYTSTGNFNNLAVASASAAVDFSTSYPNYIQIGYRAAGDTNNQTGNPTPEATAYYSYYTATLGFSYYNDGKTSGSSSMDICPKGWRLPKVSDSGTSVVAANAEFANLARAYNSSASWSGQPTQTYQYYTSDGTIRQNMIKGDSGSLNPELDTNSAAGFTYAGRYNGTTLGNVGTSGLYWSSSIYDTNSSYNLRFNTSNVFPQNYSSKYLGNAVRCVAQ